MFKFMMIMFYVDVNQIMSNNYIQVTLIQFYSHFYWNDARTCVYGSFIIHL